MPFIFAGIFERSEKNSQKQKYSQVLKAKMCHFRILITKNAHSTHENAVIKGKNPNK
ncbi:hypothetical protein [Helicobacter sp. 23-1045]